MAPEFGAESMIHRAVRQSIGYANAAVLHPRLTLSPSPLNCPTCSDKTCHPTRHIAYDPGRTAEKTNGRDAETSSSYSAPDYFQMKTAAGRLPESRKWCATGGGGVRKGGGEKQKKRKRDRSIKLTLAEVFSVDSRYSLLPGETYILKRAHCKLHAKTSPCNAQ